MTTMEAWGGLIFALAAATVFVIFIQYRSRQAGESGPAGFSGRLILTNRKGQPVFFPWGGRGGGYLLRDRQAGERVRRLLSRFVLVWVWLAIFATIWLTQLYSLAVAMSAAFGLLGLYLLGYGFLAWWLTRSLKPSPDTYAELLAEQAAS